MWQQGAQTRWKEAMDREISGRPSITMSNSWFDQSVMSSEVRPASCAGARLSHQPPVPHETNTGEQQQLLPESTESLGCQSLQQEASQELSAKVRSPYPPCPPGGAGHCFNQRDGEAQGSCCWGLMQGSSPDMIEISAHWCGTVLLSHTLKWI